MICSVPRAPTTADVFNAIGESRRRDIIERLAIGGAQPVQGLVEALQIPQPTISKHLAVLRKVGLVAVSRRGPRRIYSVNAKELKAVHDWTSRFERFWTDQLGRIKERAERAAAEAAGTAKPRTED